MVIENDLSARGDQDKLNVGGPAERVADVVAAIEDVLPGTAGQITLSKP